MVNFGARDDFEFTGHRIENKVIFFGVACLEEKLADVEAENVVHSTQPFVDSNSFGENLYIFPKIEDLFQQPHLLQLVSGSPFP